jgi:hypothetical protein
MAMASILLLADEFSPKVRFGYVDISDDEFMKETFDVKAVPAPFYLHKGIAYEMGAF